MKLPSPYQKEANPFQHFDTPRELALHRVRHDIESGWAYHTQVQAGNGWYGHQTEVRYDKLIVLQCAGDKMEVTFNYKELLREVEFMEQQLSLFS